MVAWQCAIKRQQDDKMLSRTSEQLNSEALSRARLHAEQLGHRCNVRVLAERFALWRLIISVAVEHRLTTSKHVRCEGLGRAFIVKLQLHLTKQRILYRWLWVCPPKPREVEFPQFSDFKQPPTFYVRPVADDSTAGPLWPMSYLPSSDESVWAQVPHPPAFADRLRHQSHHARSGNTPHTENKLALMNGQASSPVAKRAETRDYDDQFGPLERYEIAARAMTSDHEYQRLFEHHRREAKGTSERCHLSGCQAPKLSGEPHHLSSVQDAELVAESVCQRMAQRLTAPATNSVPAGSRIRPQSAKR
jgi:hypothetical protein